MRGGLGMRVDVSLNPTRASGAVAPAEGPERFTNGDFSSAGVGGFLPWNGPETVANVANELSITGTVAGDGAYVSLTGLSIGQVYRLRVSKKASAVGSRISVVTDEVTPAYSTAAEEINRTFTATAVTRSFLATMNAAGTITFDNISLKAVL